ncbi:hypothetical protein [Vibrio lentus]|uniref:hypothetical protein n=1 Tax=Vibrio lentus TaxID=136468 RepID=UPI001F52F358|nr:hypothetical protein [Vibrio lentus]
MPAGSTYPVYMDGLLSLNDIQRLPGNKLAISFNCINFIKRARYIKVQFEHFRATFYPLSSDSWVRLRQFVLRRYIGGIINLSDAVYTAFTTVLELYQLAADEMFKDASNWPAP